MAEALELPLASIQRVCKTALPANVSLSKDVKQAFSKAAALFILYLTSTANDLCHAQGRSMVNGDDVLSAVEELEFEHFLPPLQDYLKEFREEAAAKRKPRASAAQATDGSSPAQPAKKKAPAKRKSAGAAPAAATAAGEEAPTGATPASVATGAGAATPAATAASEPDAKRARTAGSDAPAATAALDDAQQQQPQQQQQNDSRSEMSDAEREDEAGSHGE